MEGIPIFKPLKFMKYSGHKVKDFKKSYESDMGVLKQFHDTKNAINQIMTIVAPMKFNFDFTGNSVWLDGSIDFSTIAADTTFTINDTGRTLGAW